MVKSAKKVVIYCGAGISVSSGIQDIASKKKFTETGNRLQLQPTKAHHAISALYTKKFIHHVVTQNHDGL
jgi:NAD-dependent SIR2 family protein deacetylase